MNTNTGLVKLATYRSITLTIHKNHSSVMQTISQTPRTDAMKYRTDDHQYTHGWVVNAVDCEKLELQLSELAAVKTFTGRLEVSRSACLVENARLREALMPAIDWMEWFLTITPETQISANLGKTLDNAKAALKYSDEVFLTFHKNHSS